MAEKYSQTVNKFNPVLISLHWFMVFLIVAVYLCMELSDFFPKGSEARGLLKSLHFMFGLSVLMLVLVRVVVRLATTVPEIIPAPKPFEKMAAKIMHIALYVFMLCMPLVGWLILSSQGKSVPFFGFELPPLIGENKDLQDILREIHEIGATIGYVLLGGHAAAGLFHHYVKKDNTLLRLLFSKK